MKYNSIFKKIYIKSLLPNVLIVLGGTVNVFFDGILVGQKLGDIGLDAVNQCLPFYLMLCTIGSLIASGSMTLSAIAAGNDDLAESKRIYSVGLFLSIVLSVGVCLLSYIFLNPLCSLLANSSTLQYVHDYLRVTIIFGIFKVLEYNFVFYLRLEGKLKRSSFAMILMTVINITLDYVFLFILNMGIYGAALASGIATFIASTLCFIFLYTDNSNYKVSPSFPKKGDIKSICIQGSPMAINNITSSLRIFLFNQIFKMIGIDDLVVVFAIISNLNEFSICIQNGVPQTGTAIIGILYGGKEYMEIKDLLKIEIKVGLLLSLLVTIGFILFSNHIPMIFGSDGNFSFAIICFALSLMFATINSIFVYYYNSIVKIQMANIITVLRGLILPVSFLFLLKGLPNYIWLLYPITEIICLVIIVLITSIKNSEGLSKIYLLDEEYEKSGKIYSKVVKANSLDISSAAQGVNEFCENYELTPKKTMTISLSIEEMLVIIAEKSLNYSGEMELRVFKKDDDIILRIRSGGDYYNPFTFNDNSLDYMGVQMIEKMAKEIQYQSTLGINTLIVEL